MIKPSKIVWDKGTCDHSQNSLSCKNLCHGITPVSKPFYLSKVVRVSKNKYELHASIYNDDVPMQICEMHFVNGARVERKIFGREEVFNHSRIYEEGVMHFESFARKDYTLWRNDYDTGCLDLMYLDTVVACNQRLSYDQQISCKMFPYDQEIPLDTIFTCSGYFVDSIKCRN